MTPITVPVALGDRSYDIFIGEKQRFQLSTHLKDVGSAGSRIFILTDEQVWAAQGSALAQALDVDNLRYDVLQVHSGEATKAFSTLETVLETLIEHGAERSDVLVAFGGGVVGDLAGLVAGLMKRGMPFIQVPTTLLSQVDSSVGGKTAINSRFGKNLIGLFNQPKRVIIDIDTLKTLDPREWRAGYAEVIKYGLIDRPDFFAWLEASTSEILSGNVEPLAHAVATSCRAKAAIVSADETERGQRALLNLGHTFGHAIERAYGFDGRVLHGEAVATGCAMAYRFSAELGLCDPHDLPRIESLLTEAGLAPTLSALGKIALTADELLEHMRHDKKAESGALTLILAKGLGQAFVQKDVDPHSLRRFLEAEIKR